LANTNLAGLITNVDGDIPEIPIDVKSLESQSDRNQRE